MMNLTRGRVSDYCHATPNLGKESSNRRTSARLHNRTMTDSFRIERDTMGDMRVPASALYGPQTARAVHNFPISGKRFPRSFIRALGIVKSAAATMNGRMGHLPAALAASIEAAAEQVVEGRYDDAVSYTHLRAHETR